MTIYNMAREISGKHYTSQHPSMNFDEYILKNYKCPKILNTQLPAKKV